MYNIKVKNPNGKQTGPAEEFAQNGEKIKEKQVLLKDDGGSYLIEVLL